VLAARIILSKFSGLEILPVSDISEIDEWEFQICFELPYQLTKYSRAVKRVSWLEINDFAATISLPFISVLSQSLMMRTEVVPEMLVISNQLTQLIAREYFVAFSRRENFKSFNSVSAWKRPRK
jgi:hypothetical protein